MLAEQMIPFLRRSVGEIEGFGCRAYGARVAKFCGVAGSERKLLKVVPDCRAGHSDFRDFRETLLDDKAVAKIHAEASAVGRLRDEIYKEVTAIEKASEARKVAKDAAGLEGKRKRRGSGVLPARMATPSDHKPAKNEIAEGVGRVVCQGGLPAGGSPDYGHSRQAIEMHEHGCSIEEIAEKLEYYPATVKGWIEATEREKEREKATVETN